MSDVEHLFMCLLAICSNLSLKIHFIYLAASGLSWGMRKLCYVTWHLSSRHMDSLVVCEGSVATPLRLGCSMAYGIVATNQGSNPCPLLWKADS